MVFSVYEMLYIMKVSFDRPFAIAYIMMIRDPAYGCAGKWLPFHVQYFSVRKIGFEGKLELFRHNEAFDMMASHVTYITRVVKVDINQIPKCWVSPHRTWFWWHFS